MQSSDVRAKRFSAGSRGILGGFSERYPADGVDAFMAECAAALEAHERGRGPVSLRSDDIVVRQFGYTRFGAGYDPDEVDEYLDEIVKAMRVHEGAAPAAAPPLPAVAAHGVRSKTFATRGMGAVDREAVDAYLARCADALDAAEHGRTPELTPQDVLAARFPRAVVRLGYDSDEVDAFLGDVAASLAAYAARG